MVKHRFFPILILLGLVFSACGPSQAELDAQATNIAADIFATQTAEAPIATATPPAPPAVDLPIPDGWVYYEASGFRIALPGRWDVVDVEEEGIDAIMDLMNTLDTEWARSISEMFTTEAMRELIKFWAMDTEPAGAGYATANITFQSLGIPFEIDDFCAQMNSVYKQMDIEIIEDLCDLRINDMDTARFTIRLKVGAISIKQFQYVYMKEKKLWALSIGVDETVWSEFEPTFITIAETFFVD